MTEMCLQKEYRRMWQFLHNKVQYNNARTEFGGMETTVEADTGKIQILYRNK